MRWFEKCSGASFFLCIILLDRVSDQGVSSLKINRLQVPTSVLNGSSLFLSCYFDLEGETLYSIKWYRDFAEFYRFLPSNAPDAAQNIGLKGAHVDVTRSNSTHIFLSVIDLDSEGIYTCEVSTEGTYSTVQAGEFMQVYVLPTESPYIEGIPLNKTFDLDAQSVNLTCVTGASRPAARVSWFLDDDMAPANYLIYYPTQTLINGLQIRKVGISLQILPETFRKSVLKIRCSATILLSYEFEAVTVLSHVPDFDPTSHDSNTFYSKDGPEVPSITGSRPRYRVGDWVNLNCSTSSSDYSLKWYINGNDAGRGKQTNEFIPPVEQPASGWILGLKLYMHKEYFQLPELRLKCVSTYHHILKESQAHLYIYFRSSNAIEAQSTISGAACHSSTSLAIAALLAAFVPILFSVKMPPFFGQVLFSHAQPSD